MDDGGARQIAYEPGLDGLRALAVVAVLVYHGELTGGRGGFLGVSVFFTLSGYLITSLLVREHATSGSVSLGRFWSRRLRRLAPASLACVALVLVTARWLLDAGQQQALAGDAWATLAYVANWRFVLAGQSYADMFASAPSPLLHFWSLAVEEQFYLVYPLVMFGALTLARRRRWVMPVVLGGLALSSLGALVATADRDLAYYGTHTRAAEFLVGALLALAVGRGLLASRVGSRSAAWLSPVAAVGFLALVATTDQQAGWLYRGGFSALGMLWVVLIAGAVVPGPLRRALSIAPVVAVGKASYGIYLYHWPVFLAIDADRVGFDGPALFALRVAVSGALAAASYHLLEQPIRHRRLLPKMPAAASAYAVAMVALVAVAALMPYSEPDPSYADAPERVVDFDQPGQSGLGAAGAAAADPSDAGASEPGGGTAGESGDGPSLTTTSTVAPEPLRVLVLGGDPLLRLRLSRLSAEAPVELVDGSPPGCPLVHDLLDAPGAVALPEGCAPVGEVVAAATAADDVDLLAVALGEPDRASLAAVEAAGSSRNERFERTANIADETIAAIGLLAAGEVPVLLADPGGDDLVTDIVAEAAVASDAATVDLSLPDDEVLRVLAQAAGVTTEDAAAPVERLAVMVIGDSTSYGIAVELDRQAGERLDVVWAGRNNCPLLPVDEVFWWDGASFPSGDCPQAGGLWAEVAAGHGPDVILGIATLPEQARQRYPGDDRWHEPGDDAFVAAHDVAMLDLQRLAAEHGAVVLLTDAPPITSGAFSGADMSDTDRVEAWNQQMARWADQWQSVEVIPWSAPLLAAEDAAGMSLRDDGVHVNPEPLAALVRDYLAPAIEQTTARLREQLAASGCRPDGRLDLTVCARPF